MADIEFYLEEDEARQFVEICHEAGETPESVLVKFAKAVVHDEEARIILFALANVGEWGKYKFEAAPDDPPRTLSPQGEACAARAADYGACDRCGKYFGCFPDEAPEFLKKYLD